MIKETESGREKVKLSVKDKKLLQLLIQDSRMSVTQLAKKVGISKPAVTQKIKSLKKRGVLLNYALHTSPPLFDTDMYTLGISTQLGMETREVNTELLKIKEIMAVLWYSGNYNLVMGIRTSDPGEIIDKIEKVIEIKKFKITRVRSNWFHPPHLFKEIKDKQVLFSKPNPKLDATDKNVLSYLHGNPNATFAEISENTKLSPVTIKKRLMGLEKNRTILGFRAFVDPWLCGKEVVGISFMVKGKEESEKILKHLLQIPQTSNVWEFDDEWNISVIFWVENQIEVNKILNDLYRNFKILDADISILVAMVGK